MAHCTGPTHHKATIFGALFQIGTITCVVGDRPKTRFVNLSQKPYNMNPETNKPDTNMSITFTPFPKMARLSRECCITEKIDGTNASIRILKPEVGIENFDSYTAVVGDRLIYAGSRTRWITPDNDNFGFARWVKENAEELLGLGDGHHFGEWWGKGIQRNYGLDHKRFSLFNTYRWSEHDQPPIKIADAIIDKRGNEVSPEKWTQPAPVCCHVVPVLYRGLFATSAVNACLWQLKVEGSKAAPEFMNPEGVVVYHVAGNVGFKKTLDNDDQAKGNQ